MKKPAPKKTAKPPVIHHKPVTPPAPVDEPSPRRRDRVQQSVYLIPAAYEQLRFLAYNKRIKMHDVLMRGLDLAFREEGLKSLDELKADDPRESPEKKR